MVHATAEPNPSHVPEDWYARSFGELYPLLYQHRDDASAAAEVADLTRLLNLKPGHRVADICCGTGRHLAALLAENLNAFGLDLSQPLLRTAVARPGLRNRVVRGDLRCLPFADKTFHAALNLFTSFGYFADEAENHASLVNMVRLLQPGGRLLIDHIHAPHLRHTLQPHSRRPLEGLPGLTVENHRHIADNRVVNHITVHHDDHQRTFTESVRLYEPAEFTAMLQAAGLEDVRLLSSFAGDPLQPDSSRMIALGVRP